MNEYIVIHMNQGRSVLAELWKGIGRFCVGSQVHSVELTKLKIKG